MYKNVEKFMTVYATDPELRERLDRAEQLYPGSLEMREGVVSEMLLPVAAELGLAFTVEELRRYEEELWEYNHQNVEDDGSLDWDKGGEKYWLMGRGWSSDESRFCGG